MGRTRSSYQRMHGCSEYGRSYFEFTQMCVWKTINIILKRDILWRRNKPRPRECWSTEIHFTFNKQRGTDIVSVHDAIKLWLYFKFRKEVCSFQRNDKRRKHFRWQDKQQQCFEELVKESLIRYFDMTNLWQHGIRLPSDWLCQCWIERRLRSHFFFHDI